MLIEIDLKASWVLAKNVSISSPGPDKIFRCLRAKKFYWSLPTKFAYDFSMIEISKIFDSKMNFKGRNEESF